MWQFWKRKPSPIQLVSRQVDFTEPTLTHWANFEHGSNYNAHFAIRGDVAKGDEILVRMQSGRVARYCLYSAIRDFHGVADWKVVGCICGYESPRQIVLEHDKAPAPKIKGLLGDGSGSLRSSPSKPPDLPSGFTEPTSEFWKVLARDEACRARADRLRTAGNLRLG